MDTIAAECPSLLLPLLVSALTYCCHCWSVASQLLLPLLLSVLAYCCHCWRSALAYCYRLLGVHYSTVATAAAAIFHRQENLASWSYNTEWKRMATKNLLRPSTTLGWYPALGTSSDQVLSLSGVKQPQLTTQPHRAANLTNPFIIYVHSLSSASLETPNTTVFNLGKWQYFYMHNNALIFLIHIMSLLTWQNIVTILLDCRNIPLQRSF